MSGIKACVSLLEDVKVQIEAIEKASELFLPDCLFRIAKDGKELLRILTKEPPPNILILDVNTPILSGWDVLRAVKARPDLDWLPVVMFSSDDSLATRRKATELKATALMAKPTGMDSPEQMGKALIEIIKLYAAPDSVVRPITKPLIHDSMPVAVPTKSLDELLAELDKDG